MNAAERRRAQRRLREAFRFLDDVVRNPDAFPERFIVVPMDEDVLPKLFSPERIRLLRVLRRRGPMASVGALSVRLHRDETRVSRDLAVLADMGLVALERTGKSKRIRAEPKPILLV